jgi:hypothetical protein
MENKEKQQLDALTRYVESTCGSLIGSVGSVLVWTIAGLPLAPVIVGAAATFIMLGMIDFHFYLKQRYA